MIENQSDNIDIKENDVSNQDNAPENNSSSEDKITENKELSPQKTEEINTEELKNTISNNDARLEQLEKEHETLKNQYVRISADFDNFRKRQSRDQDDLKIQLVSKTLTAILPIVDNFDPYWNESSYVRKDLLPGIYKYFEDYGVEYFKDLDIWHIPQLRKKLNE